MRDRALLVRYVCSRLHPLSLRRSPVLVSLPEEPTALFVDVGMAE